MQLAARAMAEVAGLVLDWPRPEFPAIIVFRQSPAPASSRLVENSLGYVILSVAKDLF